MTIGDREPPRRRFARRLNELFAVADLTNDRVATLANELVRDRRVSGLTDEDKLAYRRVNARRLSEWRHPSEPAVPQRWIQLAAVLTALVEKARRKGSERVELYDMAAWRQLYDEAAKSSPAASDMHPALELADHRGVLPQPPADPLCIAWNVPPRLTFVGREEALRQLSERLSSGPAVVLAFHGIAGAGKTTLAMECAYRFAGLYRSVWWIDAERPELLGEQLFAFGVAADWVQPDADLRSSVAVIRGRLRSEGRWLFVFDNARTPADVMEFIPQGPGDVILTSRSAQWGQVGEMVSVDVFEREESVALLRRLAPAMATHLEDQISNQLGDLPLAIAQAAAVLAVSGISGIGYLTELKERPALVMEEGRVPGYQMSLAASIKVALSSIATESSSAPHLLQICAVLAPEPIPMSLFTNASADALTTELSVFQGSEWRVGLCLALLGRYRLVTVGAEGPYMHRLLQAIIIGQLDSEAQLTVRRTAENLIVAASPRTGGDPNTWPTWARLLPHLLALDLGTTTNADLRKAAYSATWYLLAHGDIAGGHMVCTRLHQAWRRMLGDDHPDTLRAAHNLARAHRRLGEYERARELDVDVFERRRTLFGPDDHDTLASAGNLALDLRHLGFFADALAVNHDTWSRRRRLNGENDIVTLRSANNLAMNLHKLGRVQEASELQATTWKAKQIIVGDDHPTTLESAHNLAVDLRGLGRLEEALLLHRETLEHRRRVLGENHPDSLDSAFELAEDLGMLGRLDEAMTLHEETLDRRRLLLGVDHPDTCASAERLRRFARE